MTEELWAIIAAGRNGVLATIGRERHAPAVDVYYLADLHSGPDPALHDDHPAKGRNLCARPRSLHVAGRTSSTTPSQKARRRSPIASEPNDATVEELFEVHSALGAASERDGFGAEMVGAHRMVVRTAVSRVYGLVRPR